MNADASNKVSTKPSNKVSTKPSNKVSTKPSNKVSTKPSNKVSTKPSNKVSTKLRKKVSDKLSNKVQSKASSFSERLVRWQQAHGRHDLPWQRTRDPYRIWLSEIMLQQTQVGTVIPYYERFLARFPDVHTLAGAEQEDVLKLWSGLGYYSRARNLHSAARTLVSGATGAEVFPQEVASLQALPGIGRSTAAAIAAFAFGKREPILDGNVKRVLSRHFAVPGFPGDKRVEDRLWLLAESLSPAHSIEHYTQGLMDLGATLCTRTRPRCDACPVSATCNALKLDRVAEFPEARARKSLPRRATTMLLLLRGAEILFEKRPVTGIWGGLWCLPELPDGASPEAWSRERFGCDIGPPEALPDLAHGFTHFRLSITPLMCQVTRTESRVAQAGPAWFDRKHAGREAIPVPVRKILAQIAGSKAATRTGPPFGSRGRG